MCYSCNVAAKTLECEALAEAGVRHRMREYYLPMFESFLETTNQREEARALDCGCGNGIYRHESATEAHRTSEGTEQASSSDDAVSHHNL